MPFDILVSESRPPGDSSIYACPSPSASLSYMTSKATYSIHISSVSKRYVLKDSLMKTKKPELRSSSTFFHSLKGISETNQ